MPKLRFAFAAALPALLLSSCGSREPAPAPNEAVAAEANGLENAAASDPTPQPGPSTNASDDAVPPPDAVSHPDGYLPPAPGEADPAKANSSSSDESPPTTEDEYMRNRQAGR